MSSTPALIATPQTASPLWITRWIMRRRIIFVTLGAGYLPGVLSPQPFTLVRFLLLTMVYGAWLAVFALKGQRGERPGLWWFLALLGLACVSQFISLPSANLDWLAILPTTTACLIAAMAPRRLGLLAAGVLWLSSSLAFSISEHGWDTNAQLILLFSFGAFVGLSVTIRELIRAHTALEHSNAELALAHVQLQNYSAQVEEIGAVRERNRIAREIHDTLGHSLTLLAVQLETAVHFEMRADPALHEELMEARRVAKACLTDVRSSVEALRPDDGAIGLLQDRLRLLAATFGAASHEPEITLDLEEATRPVSPEIAMTLYRCAQEALTNIRKHARATKVLLSLSTSDEPRDHVELRVLDNGRGAASGRSVEGLGYGLVGIRERVALLDGEVRAGPEPEHGWRVEVVIPLGYAGRAKQAQPACDTGRRDE